MKKKFLLISSIILAGCGQNHYSRVKNYIDTLKIVDTHEHQQTPADPGSFYLLNTSYYPGDLYNAGASTIYDGSLSKFNADSLWAKVGKYYRYTRATSYHEQLMNNLRILYGYKKPYLEKDDVQELYTRMYTNHYKNYPEWFREVYQKANFEVMVQDQHWNRFNTAVDTTYFRTTCNIQECVTLISEAAENKKITSNKNLLKLIGRDTLNTNSLDDYTNLIDSVLTIFKRSGAVCLKSTLAYHRTLDFEDVSYADAREIFNKTGPINDKDKKSLEDFVFHHIIGKSIKLDLPIQIHTGYLAGMGGRIDYGQPMKLINLFIKYPLAKFILFHGGYPWTGDFVALGKQFRNVYLDLVWLPQLSKTVAIRTLHEMLDAVSYNKILWGGDVNRIDDAVGSLELGKEVVATVLAERMDKGDMTEDLAFDIAKSIFHDNAVELFHLGK